MDISANLHLYISTLINLEHSSIAIVISFVIEKEYRWNCSFPDMRKHLSKTAWKLCSEYGSFIIFLKSQLFNFVELNIPVYVWLLSIELIQKT